MKNNDNKLVRFDWAMKYILRDKSNFDILEGFLAALLNDDEIKILNILESETNSESENDKYIRVDLLVTDSNNRKIYIEIQNTRESDYVESLLYSTSKIIVENQDLGYNFTNISKVISISILYFNLGRGEDYIYYGTNEFKGLNTGKKLIIKKRIPNKQQNRDTDGLEPKYKFVEKNIFPEYYLITVERYKNIIKKRIDEWVYMFKNDEVAEGSKSKNIEVAKEKLSIMNMTKEQKRSHEKYRINAVRDRDAWETTHITGYIKGETVGIKKGIEQGIEQEKINSKKIIEQVEKEKKQAEKEKKQAEKEKKQAEKQKEQAENQMKIYKLLLDNKSKEEISQILQISINDINKLQKKAIF